MQYCLLDAEQIKELDEPVDMGYLTAPSTGGHWGHYEVGGERLRCQERERFSKGQDKGVSFCLEPLSEVKQGRHRKMSGVSQTWTEWRP